MLASMVFSIHYLFHFLLLHFCRMALSLRNSVFNLIHSRLTTAVHKCACISLYPTSEHQMYRVGGTCRVYRLHHSVGYNLLLPTLLVRITIILLQSILTP
jgi:hypothetical protein